MKPTFSSKYTEFPKASVPIHGIYDKKEEISCVKRWDCKSDYVS